MSRLNLKIKRGDLDTKIDIMHQSTSIHPDSGEQIRSWSIFLSPWALVETRTGNESVRIELIDNTSIVYFSILHYPGIDEMMRVTYKYETYDIIHIEPIGRNF